MKKALLHLSLSLAATALLTLALEPSMHAQQADQDPAPATPHRADPAIPPQSQQSDAQMPASGDATTREAKTFSGRIVKENGELVLKDPVTKINYKLSEPGQAKQYVGTHREVICKLDMNSHTIQVDE